ncbi:MAG: CBS domain-containing protein [Propionibacteriales bacterium]|nr:CBS domain-containing protein [Propionibacteriales bacterium]
MRVSDVLSSKGSNAVYTVRPDATVQELLDLLAEHNVGALVVSEDDETLIGIVSERDIVRKLRVFENARDVKVSNIMTTDVRTCSMTDSVGDLMAVITDRRIRHIPVVEDSKIVGVLSIGDAVKYRMQQLEFERDQLNKYVAGG